MAAVTSPFKVLHSGSSHQKLSAYGFQGLSCEPKNRWASISHLWIVSHKQGEAACLGNKVVQRGLRNCKAVVSGGASSKLVYDDQTPVCGRRQDVTCL